MITISPFIYPKNLGSNAKAKFEKENFEEAKKELEELYEYNSLFEGLEKSGLFDPEISMHMQNNDFLQTRVLISEIKEKQKITESLSSLSYNIGWLRSAIIIKDKNISNRAIKNILKHEDSSINAIISELDSLKNKIGHLESLHENLSKSDLSLDIRAILEQDFGEKREKLNELYNKQKNVLFSLSNIFVNLTKNSMLKGKNK